MLTPGHRSELTIALRGRPGDADHHEPFGIGCESCLSRSFDSGPHEGSVVPGMLGRCARALSGLRVRVPVPSQRIGQSSS